MLANCAVILHNDLVKLQFPPSPRPANLSEADWNNWTWQLRNSLKTQSDFAAHFELAPDERAAFEAGKEDRDVSERDEKREARRAEAKREKDEYQDDLDLLKDAAEDCRIESTKSEKLKCVIDVYSDTLSEEISFKYKNRKGETVTGSRQINAKAALDFYTKNIESGVKSDLRRTGGNSALYEVLASLPSDFNNVRQKALSSSTVALYEATVDYRDSIARAMQSRSPVDQVRAQKKPI
jgi:hypothetical protein